MCHIKLYNTKCLLICNTQAPNAYTNMAHIVEQVFILCEEHNPAPIIVL